MITNNEITIWRPIGAPLFQHQVVNDSSSRVQSMSDDYLELKFMRKGMTAIPSGSYIDYQDLDGYVRRYRVIEEYRPIKKSEELYEYDVKFLGLLEILKKPVFQRVVAVTEGQITTKWREPEFTITSNLSIIAGEIIKALNEDNFYGVVFSLPSGHTYAEKPVKTITFNGDSIFNAMSAIADEYETEFWIEYSHNATDQEQSAIVHFDKCERGDYLSLSDKYTEEQTTAPLGANILDGAIYSEDNKFDGGVVDSDNWGVNINNNGYAELVANMPYILIARCSMPFRRDSVASVNSVNRVGFVLHLSGSSPSVDICLTDYTRSTGVVSQSRIETGDENCLICRFQPSRSGSYRARIEMRYSQGAHPYLWDIMVAKGYSVPAYVKGRTIGGYHSEMISRGLLSVSAPEVKSNINVLFPIGSDRNIKPKTTTVEGGIMNVSYNTKLKLSANTTYSVVNSKGQAVNVRTGASGELFVNENLSHGTGEVKEFPDVYPHRVFTISAVRHETKTSKDGDYEVYYIKSPGIKPSSSSMSSSIDPKEYLIEGTTMSLSFLSGYLIGQEFELSWLPSSEELEIINNTSGEITVPFGTFVPRVGDTFALLNIEMPSSYVTSAQQELAQKAYSYLESVMEENNEIECKTEPSFIKKSGQGILYIGRKIQLLGTAYGDIPAGGSETVYQSRIQSLNYSPCKPYDINLTLATSRSTGRLAMMQNAIIEQANITDGVSQKAKSVSRRAWRDALELSQMLESIKAEFALIGNEDYQFTHSCATSVYQQYQGLSVGKGQLQHTNKPYTQGSNKGLWVVAQAILTTDLNGNTLDDDNAYYAYVKCHRSDFTSDAEVILSNTKINVDEGGTHWYFLLGVLSSKYEGVRSFAETSGMTQIAGGQITTNRMQDPNKQLIIDFSANPPRIIARNGAVIEGAIKFTMPDGTPASIGGDNIARNSYKYRKGIGSAFGWVAEHDDHFKVSDISIRLEPGRTYIITCMSDGLWYGVNSSGWNNDNVDLYLALNGTYDEYIYLEDIGTKQILADGRLAWLFTVPNTYTEGDYFVRFDVNKQGCEHYLWDLQCIESSNIATEWRKSELDPDLGALNISLLLNYSVSSVGNSQRLTERLNGGDVIVFTCDSATGNAYLALYTGGMVGKRIAVSDKPIYYTIPDNGNAYYLYIYNDVNTPCNVQGISVRKYKDYNIDTTDHSLDYLREAITQGGTSVQGGLVMTNIMEVQNRNGVVTAGMNGMTADPSTQIEDLTKPAFWAGGTFAEAIAGIANILLRFNGTGKIGCFEIYSDHVKIGFSHTDGGVEVSDGYATFSKDGIKIYDANDVLRVCLVGTDISMSNFVTAGTYVHNQKTPVFPDSKYYLPSGGYFNRTGEEYRLFNSENASYLFRIRQGNNYAKIYTSDNTSDTQEHAPYLRMTVEVSVPNTTLTSYFYVNASIVDGNGNTLISSSNYFSRNYKLERYQSDGTWRNAIYEWVNNSWLLVSAGEIIVNDVNSFVFNQLPVGEYYLRIGIGRSAGQATNAGIRLHVGYTSKVLVEEYDPHTIIGKNGIITYQSGNKYFGAYLEGNDFKIVGKGNVKFNNTTLT